MVKDLIGLDIGAGSIKLVKIKKNKNKIELEKARSIELKDADSIKDAVTQLLKSEGINSARAAVSLSGQSVFTRFVKLPKISEKKVEQVVKYEAQQQIPFPIEKVVWDYQLFEHKESSEIEVCLAAVKKEIVDKIISELTQLKLDIISIQPSPIALYNILKFNGEIEDDTLVLDIGEKVTDIFITKGRRIWIRSIPIAGKDITKAISGEMNLKLLR
jgi:type IV pilus assembly protein PilM